MAYHFDSSVCIVILSHSIVPGERIGSRSLFYIALTYDKWQITSPECQTVLIISLWRIEMTNSFHCPICEKYLTFPKIVGRHIVKYDSMKYGIPLRELLLECKPCEITLLYFDAEKRILSQGIRWWLMGINFQEFQGFDKFWKEARQYWSLSESLKIYHESSNPWSILENKKRIEERFIKKHPQGRSR